MAEKCRKCGIVLREENKAGSICSLCREGFVEIYLGIDEKDDIMLLLEKDKQLEELFAEIIPVEIKGRDFAEIYELTTFLSEKPNNPSGSGVLIATIPNIILQGLKKAGKLK